MLARVFKTAPFSVVCRHWFSGQPSTLLFTGTGFQNRSVCRHGFSRPPRSVCWHGFSIQPRSVFAGTGFQYSPVLCLLARVFKTAPFCCCLPARVFKTAPFSAVCWHGFSRQPRSLLFAGTGFQDSPVLCCLLARVFKTAPFSVCWHGFSRQPRSLLFAGTGFQLSPVLCCLLARVSNSAPFSVVCWHRFSTAPFSVVCCHGFYKTARQPRSLLFVGRVFRTTPFSVVGWRRFSGPPRFLLFVGIGFQDSPLLCCLPARVFRTALCSVVCRHGFSRQPLSSHHFWNWVWFKFTPALTLPRQE